ncbi:MAG: M48 family metalloprotease [Rickettsiales bacterium]|nr:M48 family metalloprotease [Rickettsiales bacterium]
MIQNLCARFIAAFSAFALLFSANTALARSLLRDAELENTMRAMTNPILEAADLNPNDVNLFIVNDDAINAFVAGGLNIFVHTGLILKAEKPEMLMGVMAHEAGHISGAHLSQLKGASAQASMGALLSYILGAAALLGGAGDAGAAIISGGQNAALRNLFSHYRGNEQQADQAGLKYMKASNFPIEGMLDMFELLRRNEKQHLSNPDPYLRTHPLTQERISTIRTAVQSADNPKKKLPEAYNIQYQRMRAKLYAFLESPKKALERYPESDTSEAGHLARAVAYFRLPNLDRALDEIDALLELRPNDPYAYDLKGQILFEHGHVDAAVTAYRKANELAPKTALILTELGKALLSTDKPENHKLALKHLQHATRLDGANGQSFFQLGRAYDMNGNVGRAFMARAQQASLASNPKDAIRYATLAKEHLDDDPAAMVVVDDVITDARRLIKERKDAKSIF